ncbi:fetal and adult testis-expressed transcript protein [Castor canadensis]|uniref:Fetal and adult testis-expressed transcript protein n=1 Tax=Castor canadensis TaxID=51338 RepID=A0A8B7TMN1_CASCN
MAGAPLNIKEEIEMSMAEELMPAIILGQTQDPLVIAEMMEHGSRSPGVSQRRPKLEPKVVGTAPKSVWSMTATRPKKMVHHLQIPRIPREPGHGDAHIQETSGNFQSIKFHHECSPEADVAAEIGLEEVDGLEMEVIKRQLHALTGRLRILEDQDATWRYKETMLFTLLVSACFANIWLWMRQ